MPLNLPEVKESWATLIMNPSMGPPLCQALLAVPLLSLPSGSVKALLSTWLHPEETEARRGLKTSSELPCQSGLGPSLSPGSCQVQLHVKWYICTLVNISLAQDILGPKRDFKTRKEIKKAIKNCRNDGVFEGSFDYRQRGVGSHFQIPSHLPPTPQVWWLLFCS